ncbi:putative short-chain dehydrogenase [Hyaloraphidium curvatum]|nr:putative short-chain dehydrogenase [Hyaloraphidium curvatum]
MSFNADTSAEEVAAALSGKIAGKNVLITGASPKSLGAEAARVLAKHGAGLVVLAGRNRKNLEETRNAILAETPKASIRLLDIDLADYDSVRKAAKEVLAYEEPLNVLINNAAIMATPYWTNKDGYEAYKKLQGKDGGRPRVINVSSNGHYNSGIRFDDIGFGKGSTYKPWEAYGQSKTANILFSRSLAVKRPDLVSLSLHPGVILTNLGRDLNPEALQYLLDLGITPDKFKYKTLGQGAATHIVAGFDAEVEKSNGAYMEDCRVAEEACAPHAKDMEAAERLWQLSNEMVGEAF